MAKLSPVLIIEDDSKVASQVAEVLRDRAEILSYGKIEEFVKASSERPKCLAIIDYDLKENDGLFVLRRLKQQNPYARTIMLSSSNNIPLAVTAAKLGALEFLRKPLIAADLVQAVERLSREEDVRGFSFDAVAGTEWLQGNSTALLGFEDELMKASGSIRDLTVLAERGIDKRAVAELVHRNGPNGGKKMVEIDLDSFKKESLEGHFWATLNELLSGGKPAGIGRVEEEPATVYIEGFETVSEHFRLSIFDFMKNKDRKNGINREIKVVLGVCEASLLPKLDNFDLLTVPPLRERKADLPAIVAELLRDRTEALSVSAETLEMLSYYDFPGNYEELENLLRSSVPENGVLSRLSLGQSAFLSYVRSLTRMYPLNRLRETFEKKLLKRLIGISGGNLHAVARFLNLPKTVLDDRMRDLDL
ncbi:MAG TPA: response regulator [Candidatus Omnitrophota bacterium]|nr:response regulator [Candidatus Omnitrophota bacterium]